MTILMLVLFMVMMVAEMVILIMVMIMVMIMVVMMVVAVTGMSADICFAKQNKDTNKQNQTKIVHDGLSDISRFGK